MCGDEKLAVKSSRVHPGMTLSRLEPALGTFVPSSRSAEMVKQSVQTPYSDRLHVRDRGARAERRQARAEARIDLRERYEKYRNAWKSLTFMLPNDSGLCPRHSKSRRHISGITRKTRICVSSCTTSWSLNVRSRWRPCVLS